MSISKMTIHFFVGVLLLFFSTVNFAHAETFGELVTSVVTGGIVPLFALLLGVGVVVFIWGIIRYLSSGGDAQKFMEGKNIMTYGVIGIFVMVSLWGLVSIIAIIFFGTVGGGTPPVVIPPTFP